MLERVLNGHHHLRRRVYRVLSLTSAAQRRCASNSINIARSPPVTTVTR